jgi:DUF4097 and DUF4098 domain-containing protein YvlB
MPARRAVRTAIALLAGSVAVSALAGCAVDIGALQHRTSSYSLSGEPRTLVVNAHVGSVRITGSDSGKVAVTERISFRGTAPSTTHRAAAGTVTLDSSCPALETCTVGYDITVPRTMTVRVASNVGEISLRSLSGPVTAHTNAGNIDLGSISGPLEATGHAGVIRGQGVSSPRATVHSSAGTIDMAFTAAPATLTATSDVGSVTLRVPGGLSYNVTTNVGVGSTHVGVTRSPASPHAITAGTRTGSVTIEPAA